MNASESGITLAGGSATPGPVRNLLSRLSDPGIRRHALVAILLGAAALRLAVAAFMPDMSGLLPDSRTYRTAATQLLSFSLISNNLHMPGYPAFIVLLGGSKLGQLLGDIALSVLSVWFIYRLAREITGEIASGLVAAGLWAVNPFSIFYSAVGLTETLFVTLLLGGFLALYRGRYLLGSIALVAAILTRPHLAYLAPLLVLVFAFFVHRERLRGAARQLAIFGAVYLAMMSPWWLHNWEKFGAFVQLNLGGAVVLYSGANPMNISGGGIGGVDTPPMPTVNGSDPLRAESQYREAAIQFIKQDPKRFLTMAIVKFERLWRPWPYAQVYRTPSIIALCLMSTVPLFLLAAAGAFRGLTRHPRAMLPIILWCGFTTCVHMLTISSMRYRFPMDPFLVILAAPIAVRLIRDNTRSSMRLSIWVSREKPLEGSVIPAA